MPVNDSASLLAIGVRLPMSPMSLLGWPLTTESVAVYAKMPGVVRYGIPSKAKIEAGKLISSVYRQKSQAAPNGEKKRSA
jgi:hypothetical protein